jgi:hypothetical protein
MQTSNQRLSCDDAKPAGVTWLGCVCKAIHMYKTIPVPNTDHAILIVNTPCQRVEQCPKHKYIPECLSMRPLLVVFPVSGLMVRIKKCGWFFRVFLPFSFSGAPRVGGVRGSLV